MLPHTIPYPFGAVEGYARASNLVNLQTRIKPLSNDSVRHIRRQNTHTAGGAGLEPVVRKHVVPTYLPLDHLPPAPRWCIAVCNRTDAGQPDVELLCSIGHLFGRATMLYPKIPLLWVVNMGLEARDPSGLLE
jgi:hypothetical protein